MVAIKDTEKSISVVIKEMERERNTYMKNSTPWRQVNRAIKKLRKLEKIEQLFDDCDSGMISCEQLFLNLRTILEQE